MNKTLGKRRIIIGNDINGDIDFISDGIASDIIKDPARPGYKSTKVWATINTPANFGKGAKRESDNYNHSLLPPKSGSISRFVTIPPDQNYAKDLTEQKIKKFFLSICAEDVSTYSDKAPHPYMHKKKSIDYVYVMKGSIVLILDDDEVTLDQGDTVVNIGANHSWSNKTNIDCELFISSHGGY